MNLWWGGWMSKFSAGLGLSPPLRSRQCKNLIQTRTLIIVNDCVCRYDNVYCVAVKNFNTGYNGYKNDLFHQGKPSRSLKCIADKVSNLILKKYTKY